MNYLMIDYVITIKTKILRICILRLRLLKNIFVCFEENWRNVYMEFSVVPICQGTQHKHHMENNTKRSTYLYKGTKFSNLQR